MNYSVELIEQIKQNSTTKIDLSETKIKVEYFNNILAALGANCLVWLLNLNNTTIICSSKIELNSLNLSFLELIKENQSLNF